MAITKEVPSSSPSLYKFLIERAGGRAISRGLSHYEYQPTGIWLEARESNGSNKTLSQKKGGQFNCAANLSTESVRAKLA